MTADAQDEATLTLEERITRLEQRFEAMGSREPKALRQRHWVLETLKDTASGAGAVLFGGIVTVGTGETYEWQTQEDTDVLLQRDWSEFADVVSSLAHPVRLMLVQRVLQGTRTVVELQADESFGTTGQLYHHLRQLVAAGWLKADGRGRYSVPVDRVVPLLALLLAADER